MTAPTKPSTSASASSAQRTLVYALTGLLCLTGLLLAMAFKDPCPAPALKMIAKCNPTIGDRMPSWSAFGAALSVQTMMMALYEMRRWVRVWGVAGAGALLIVIGGLVAYDGMSKVLVITCVVVGGALIVAARGINREQRVAWAFAAATTGTLAVVTFFSAAKIGGEIGVPLSLALLPSLAMLLPLTVALGTTAPGTAAAAAPTVAEA